MQFFSLLYIHITEIQDDAKEETKESIKPVIYAQVHRSLSSTPLMEDEMSSKNSFEMKPIESEHDQSNKNEEPKTPKKPPRSHVVVYANLQDLKAKPREQPCAHSDLEAASRHRSKTTNAKSASTDNDVSKKTGVTSPRRKTWVSRSRWYDVEDQDSMETADAVENKEDPEGSAVGVKPSSNVIYAKVDKLKKTKSNGLEED